MVSGGVWFEIKMECASDVPILRELEKMVHAFRSNPHLELEVRLGGVVDGKFNAGVDERYSLDLHTSMTDSHSMHMWKIHPMKHFVYKYFPNDIRGRYEQGVKTQFHRIIRRNAFSVVCRERKYALKFALKEEIPLPDDTLIVDSANFIKINSRASLDIHGWRYDFTKVGQGVNEDIARQSISHQIELEMMHTNLPLSDSDIAITFLGRSRDMLGRYEDGQTQVLHLDFV